MPHNYIWMGFYSMSTGIYLNSLLIALNRRKKIWKEVPGIHRFSSGGRSHSDHAIRLDVSRVAISEPPLQDSYDEQSNKEVLSEYV
ncbi:hypothetical protein BS17DRAFT_189552 [Gyrodon lividus]|nr:hypothetical protein BS17DRAFT_189552 [Gyrodon lividus]